MSIQRTYWQQFLSFLRNSAVVYVPYTWFFGKLYHRLFGDIKFILIFLGYPRSGSSTLASLLDAHKEILIGHELDLLKYSGSLYGRDQLFYMMKKNSGNALKSGRISSGYPGLIEDQYNGKVEKLRIIGDKKAGKSVSRLGNDINLIHQLGNKSQVPVKCIHLVRNPFDMIASQSINGESGSLGIKNWNLDRATDFYFQKIDIIKRVKGERSIDILDIRHENLIESPEMEIKRILTWLEIHNYDGYTDSCRKHLFKSPSRSRDKVQWTEGQKKRIQQKIEEVPFLTGYHFSS